MTETEFEQKYMTELDPQQRKAVKASDRPILLLAVPGSGKTSVLVIRLGYLALVRGIPAEKILAVTYTVAATGEMRERYLALFGEEGIGVPEFRTLNGISQKIIDCYGATCSRSEPFKLQDREGETEKLLRQLYTEINRDYADDGMLKTLRTDISYVKNMMLTKEETEKFQSTVDNFPEILRRYNAALRNACRMDYDDQLVYACRILRLQPRVLQIFREKYCCICVDEAQDTSRVQHEIIRLLVGERPSLFMVGDEDQSIYGFRAAYPEALIRFRETYSGAEILYLEQNYRSTPEIVEAANRFVAKNTDRYPKTARAVRNSGNKVERISAGSRIKQFEEAFRIAAEAGRTGRETAFLFRNNETGVPLIDRCERNGIPYNCRRFDEVFFSDRLITDIRDMAAFLQRPADSELFMRLYYKFSCCISKAEATQAAREAARTGEPVLDCLYGSFTLKEYVRNAVAELEDNLRALPKDPPSFALRRIWNEMGYGEYARKRGTDPGKMETLLLLSEAVEREKEKDATLFSLLERLETLRTVIAEHRNRSSCPILFSTIHSAKGLEFDRVCLLDVYDGVFPVINAADAESEEERKQYQEERRLFYVGITRAKNELTLFSQGRHSSFIEEITEPPRRIRQRVPGKAEAIRKNPDFPEMRRKNGLYFPVKEH